MNEQTENLRNSIWYNCKSVINYSASELEINRNYPKLRKERGEKKEGRKIRRPPQAVYRFLIGCLTLCPPDVKSWLMGKDSNAGKEWGQEEKGDDRGWDDWMASLTQWALVWVNSGREWRTGNPGMLQSMGSERAGHVSDWTTTPLWIYLVGCWILLYSYKYPWGFFCFVLFCFVLFSRNTALLLFRFAR